MKNKYHNVKTNGFDSKKEANRYLELKQMEREEKIYDLKKQVKFILIPKQKGERECTYIADFTYYENDFSYNMIVEDVKGVKTEVYRIKRKLMLFIHKIKILET